MQKRFKTVPVSCPLTGHQRDVSPIFAARITGRSLRTAQRWAAGSRIDGAASQLLALRVFGVLPGDAWHDFRLRGDRLENVVTGETWAPWELRAGWVMFQELRERRRRSAGEPAFLQVVRG